MENVEFDCFNGLKVGNTVYYGYFYNPENFTPDKHVKNGIIVELNDDDYKVKKRVHELENSINRLEKEIGAKLE